MNGQRCMEGRRGTQEHSQEWLCHGKREDELGPGT
jgi:hypothetical protein